MNYGIKRNSTLYSWKTFLTVKFQIISDSVKEAEKLPLETVFLLLDKAECQNKPKTIDVLQAAKMKERTSQEKAHSIGHGPSS